MKYIITENRIHNLVDKFFIKRYGGLLRKEVTDDDYTYFYDLENGKPFEMNSGGTLWVNDYILYKQIRSVFGFNTKEVDEFFKNYFNDRYDVNVKRVASEGGYDRGGDDLDDADPWLDEFNNESIVTEEKKDGIMKLSYDVFDNDWDSLQTFLKRRGNPPYILIGTVNLAERRDVETLGSVVEIWGNLRTTNSSLRSLGNLTKVSGSVSLFKSPVQSIGNLEYVGGGGGLNLGGTNIKSLGNLKFVADDLYLKMTPFSRMSNINTKKDITNKVLVGGTIFLDINY